MNNFNFMLREPTRCLLRGGTCGIESMNGKQRGKFKTELGVLDFINGAAVGLLEEVGGCTICLRVGQI